MRPVIQSTSHEYLPSSPHPIFDILVLFVTEAKSPQMSHHFYHTSVVLALLDWSQRELSQSDYEPIYLVGIFLLRWKIKSSHVSM